MVTTTYTVNDRTAESGRRSGDGRYSGLDPILQHRASELRSCVSCSTYKSSEYKAAPGPQERMTACSCAISKAATRVRVPYPVATEPMRPLPHMSSVLLMRCPPLAVCHAIKGRADPMMQLYKLQLGSLRLCDVFKCAPQRSVCLSWLNSPSHTHQNI